MIIEMSLTDQEAESVIEACKALKGNPVLWLLSDRLQSRLDEERDRQANAARIDAKNRARATWQHHVTTARCQACNNALATVKLDTLCERGKILYRALLDSSNV